MNILKIAASTLAVVSSLAAMPSVALASDGHDRRAEVGRDHDRGWRHDRDDHRWGYDRDGRWGRWDRDHRRDFDRDWRGYRPGWIRVNVGADNLCRFEWENGASPARMVQIGCFVP